MCERRGVTEHDRGPESGREQRERGERPGASGRGRGRRRESKEGVASE